MVRRLLVPAGCVVAACLVYFPLTDTDIWWHLAAGRLILSHGPPRVDPFAQDTLGKVWIDVHWLFQVLAYLVFRLGGAWGLVIGKCAVVGLGLWVLLRASDETVGRPAPAELRDEPRLLRVALLALPLYLARYLVLARPVVLTLLCLAAFVLVLERYRRRARPAELLWLLGVQVLWCNVQGLFLLGPAVVLCYLAGEGIGLALAGRARGFGSPLGARQLWPLAALVPALLLAALITPYGWRALLLPWTLLGRIDPVSGELFAHNITENIPPWILERSDLAAIGYFKWVTAAVFVSFVLTLRQIVLPRLLLVAALFGLALLANRNALLLCWVGGWAAACNVSLALASAGERWPRLGGALPRVLSVAALIGLAVLGARAAAAARDDVPASELAPFRVPVEAAARLDELRLEGNLFNSVRYGGYVAWMFHPRRRPAIDGRLVLRSAAQFGEHLRLLDEPDRFEGHARRHDLRIALLPTSGVDERYLPLVASLCRDRRWRLLYTDGTQALLARADDARAAAGAVVELSSRRAVQRIVDELERRYRHWPAVLEQATVNLGRLLAAVHELDRASEVLLGRASAQAQALLARVHYLAGRRAAARAVAEAQLRRGDDADTLTLLATMALDEGQRERAVSLAERALRVDPYGVAARQVLERVRRGPR
jgi:tetratricopeptide (TPR) repeat protein